MFDDARLSQLNTEWSLIVAAHQSADPGAARDAQAELLPAYCAAIYRYVQGAIHDPPAAENLCQEFAVRFVRGDFRHARPEKGRFRDYLKASLFHLVGEYYREKRDRDRPIPSDGRLLIGERTGPDTDRLFLASWRQEILNRTWTGLRGEFSGPSPTPYDVLRRKADDPAITSQMQANAFTEATGRPSTAANIRQLLHRGRERFAELLRLEVAATVQSNDPATIDEELAEMGLLVYCPRTAATPFEP